MKTMVGMAKRSANPGQNISSLLIVNLHHRSLFLGDILLFLGESGIM